MRHYQAQYTYAPKEYEMAKTINKVLHSLPKTHTLESQISTQTTFRRGKSHIGLRANFPTSLFM